MDREEFEKKLSPYRSGNSDSGWERYIFPDPLTAKIFIQGYTQWVSYNGIKEMHVPLNNDLVMLYRRHPHKDYINDGYVETLSFKDIMDVVIE